MRFSRTGEHPSISTLWIIDLNEHLWYLWVKIMGRRDHIFFFRKPSIFFIYQFHCTGLALIAVKGRPAQCRGVPGIRGPATRDLSNGAARIQRRLWWWHPCEEFRMICPWLWVGWHWMMLDAVRCNIYCRHQHSLGLRLDFRLCLPSSQHWKSVMLSTIWGQCTWGTWWGGWSSNAHLSVEYWMYISDISILIDMTWHTIWIYTLLYAIYTSLSLYIHILDSTECYWIVLVVRSSHSTGHLKWSETCHGELWLPLPYRFYWNWGLLCLETLRLWI